MRSKIAEYNNKGCPVAATIVEPVQCEGGDHYASPYFFKELQKICKEVRSHFICISILVKMIPEISEKYFYLNASSITV